MGAQKSNGIVSYASCGIAHSICEYEHRVHAALWVTPDGSPLVGGSMADATLIEVDSGPSKSLDLIDNFWSSYQELVTSKGIEVPTEILKRVNYDLTVLVWDAIVRTRDRVGWAA